VSESARVQGWGWWTG